MSSSATPEQATSPSRSSKGSSRLAVIGCVVSFIALVAAFLSPQIANLIDPPAEPIEEQAVDFASRLKDATVAKLKGEEYQAPEPEAKPSRFLPTSVIALGMLGLGFGLLGLIARERKSLALMAMGLGISAAIVQWSLIFASILIFLLIVFLVLHIMGVELPSL